MGKEKDKYSILVPTYNDRYNLPILVYLVDRELSAKYALLLQPCRVQYPLPPFQM